MTVDSETLTPHFHCSDSALQCARAGTIAFTDHAFCAEEGEWPQEITKVLLRVQRYRDRGFRFELEE